MSDIAKSAVVKTTKNQHRSNMFWWCQLIGWGAFGLFNMTVRGYFSHFGIGELVNSLALVFAFVVSTSFLRLYFQRFLRADSTFVNLVQIFVASLISAILTELIVAAILLPNQERLFGAPIENAWQQILLSMPNIIFFTLLWSAVYIVVRRQRQLRHSKRETEQLNTSLKAAQLDVLINQLNPHFVFNAINNIRALILEDKQKARDCLADLSEVMRVTMQVKQDKVWAFEEELALAESYISLNKLQLEERLTVDWQIDNNTLHQPFPCMMLQLLLENAIKHGVNQRLEGGEVLVKTSQHGGQFSLVVTNPGQICNSTPHSGVGLSNISARLQLMHQHDKLQGAAPTFALRQLDGHVIAELTLGGKGD